MIVKQNIKFNILDFYYTFRITETYLVPYQISIIEFFLQKFSLMLQLDIWLGSKYTSAS